MFVLSNYLLISEKARGAAVRQRVTATPKFAGAEQFNGRRSAARRKMEAPTYLTIILIVT